MRGFDHGEPVFDGVRHGLLAVHVFAGGAGVFEDAAVVVVHGGDDDGIDVFAVEDGAVVASGEDAGIPDGFAGGDVASVIEIADTDALDAGNAERGVKVFASANAGADGGEADSVAGRYGASGGREDARLKDGFGDGGGGQCSAA